MPSVKVRRPTVIRIENSGEPDNVLHRSSPQQVDKEKMQVSYSQQSTGPNDGQDDMPFMLYVNAGLHLLNMSDNSL